MVKVRKKEKLGVSSVVKGPLGDGMSLGRSRRFRLDGRVFTLGFAGR